MLSKVQIFRLATIATDLDVGGNRKLADRVDALLRLAADEDEFDRDFYTSWGEPTEETPPEERIKWGEWASTESGREVYVISDGTWITREEFQERYGR